MISPWIHTTNKCQMNCEYCRVTKGKETMPREVYDAAITKLSSFDHDLKVRLSGGEPMLASSVWVPIVWHYRKIKFNIITSLPHIPSDVLELFLSGRLCPSVSVDTLIRGNGKGNRKGVEFLSERDIQMSVMTTITKRNVGELPLVAEFVSKNNIENWRVDCDYDYDGDPSPVEVERNFFKAVDILLKNNYDINKLRLSQCSIEYDGCGYGNVMVSVDTNGDLYHCHREIRKQKPIGNIMRNVEIEKIFRVPESIEKDHCPAFSVCHGQCPISSRGRKKLCGLMRSFSLLLMENKLKETKNAELFRL